MSTSPLSFASTSSFRNKLLAKNLAPYNVPGVYSPPSGPTTYEEVLSNYNVQNSPDALISQDPFANNLYPLNEYGPDGGYNLNINYNGPLLPVPSNQGPYAPTDTNLDLVNEFFIDAAFIENRFGPTGGFQLMYYTTDTPFLNKTFNPYWDPPSFVPSIYSPYTAFLENNPTGSDGSLSSDSYLAQISIATLKTQFSYNVDREIRRKTVGAINLDALTDPFEASLLVTGQQPLIYKNYQITVPENPIIATADFATRIAGAYWPVSFIPGDYFDDNQPFEGSKLVNLTKQITEGANTLLGGALGPILNLVRSPSEIFLKNTGNGQRSVLFANLDLNLYSPQYDRGFGGITGVIVNLAQSLINPNGTVKGSYYVGSKNAEPSTITSPTNQIPVDAFGRQVQTPVFGPSELGQLYEGNIESLNFGLAGKSSSDGGGLDGQFLWTSPKYKPAAGKLVNPGGDLGKQDGQYTLVSAQISKDESTNLTYKELSILDTTQRLVNSADKVTGKSRLKHVGNAINQVSKVFNDGYKEITKGSKVIYYYDSTTNSNTITKGTEKGAEYCRIFAKDTPYYTYADLQKTDGITTSGRRFTYSVLDNTYNLNIAPLKNPGSTNIIGQGSNAHVKKYMFSIENLAWKNSTRPGLRYDDLPVCERGPNGGRVMWFPPYELKFNDSSIASWNTTNFLGRPEPIYTYKDTQRTGQISWKIIVDHPSILNLIVNKQLANKDDAQINSIVDSFFAGCVKYDIYELAKKFNTFPIDKLYTLQEKISRMTPEELAGTNSEVKGQGGTGASTGTDDNSDNIDYGGSGQGTTPSNSKPLSDYNEKQISLYFDNDIPLQTNPDVKYKQAYDLYVSDANRTSYKENAPKSVSLEKAGSTFTSSSIPTIFDGTIKYEYNEMVQFILDVYNTLNQNDGTVTFTLVGTASAPQNETYNVGLSSRRTNCVENFILDYPVGQGKSLRTFTTDNPKRLIIKKDNNGESDVVPRMENNGNAESISCTDNIKDDSVKQVTHAAQIYSVPAMACRRVRVKDIDFKETPKPSAVPNKDTNTGGGTTGNIPGQSTPPTRTKTPPEITVEQKIKEGISKEILRGLLSECDYFELIKENEPMIYNTFKEKIKHFNPAFHSMTPEGLNARLTFLNQCVRPGDTVPKINPDGTSVTNDALNTSFGSPPVLILRIGDFYNTKIIPENVSFNYDPMLFDINPEGIGVQPMIANVTLTFKIIGGMGLKEPIEQLQNALSFNYYANTEIYDERSTWTDDSFKKIDEQIVKDIITSRTPPTSPTPPQPNGGGDFIGKVLTTAVETGTTSGQISYTTVRNSLITESQTYMNNIVNQSDTILKNYNFGILALYNASRNFKNGKIGNDDTELYGKSDAYEDRMKSLFDMVINDINTIDNPILNKMFFNNQNYKESTQSMVKTNMVNFITKLKSDFANKLATVTQDITNEEQTLITLVQKLNFVITSNDGKIQKNGTPTIITLTALDNSLYNINNDLKLIRDNLSKFIKKTNNEWLITSLNSWDTTTSTWKTTGKDVSSDEMKEAAYNRFYSVILQTLLDKNTRNNFIDTVIDTNVKELSKNNNEKSILKEFTKQVDSLTSIYEKQNKIDLKLISSIKSDSEFKTLTTKDPVPKTQERICGYVNNDTPSGDISQNLLNIYSTVNSNQDKSTYNGKVKLN